jgi:hypothetical protein
MRTLPRLLALCALLLTTVLAATALAKPDADRAAKPPKTEKADKGEKTEKPADADGAPGTRPARPAHPHGGAPGQTGEHPLGGAPGQLRRGEDASAPVPPHPEDLRDDDADADPELGESVATEPAAGVVLVKRPGTDVFVPLADDAAVPVGSTVDATRGLVEVRTESDRAGAEQSAVVSGGVFTILQNRSAAPITELVLEDGDFSDCPRPGRAAARPRAAIARTAGSRRRSGSVVRGLWAAGKGRFRTRGRNSAATVRGTRWATVDRCGTTTTRVYEGVVDVEDLTTGRTHTLRTGEKHVAHERRG